MSSFGTYERKRPKANRKPCPRCGGPTNVGRVLLQLQKLKPTGAPSHNLDSRSRSLCESCAIDVYERLLATFDEQMEFGA